MHGYIALVLHAHLPWVRHPESPRFLEENWLFEAITECYLPLLEKIEGWSTLEGAWGINLTLTPTLCAMLQDSLLKERYDKHLNLLLELAERETFRTYWDKQLKPVAEMYLTRLRQLKDLWLKLDRDLVAAFARWQNAGCIEILGCAATHALLPLLEDFADSLHAQIETACVDYERCFGKRPTAFWLPECAYSPRIEPALARAGIRWFVTESHGLLHARPQPRYGTLAPVLTPKGLVAFARDNDSARQVWSREAGYPGDAAYRDFYRDIAFELDYDYLARYLPAAPQRTFTGFKYHAIGNRAGEAPAYDRPMALRKAAEHAAHFLEARRQHLGRAAEIMECQPIIMVPYDAELFGHWWYEGPEFLDYFVRKTVCEQDFVRLTTVSDYLGQHSRHQVAEPCTSSWGEEGFWKVWLNETNEWIYPHLRASQERMSELARQFTDPDPLQERALNQAGRELLLAQSSDWPFIMRAGTSPEYAKKRLTEHLLRFHSLHEQLTTTQVDELWLNQVEDLDCIFPKIDYRAWRG